MTDDRTPQDDSFDEDAVLAGELALGLLEGTERSHAERRRRTEPVFDAQVSAWEHNFASMTNHIAPVDPPVGLFRKIAAEAYPDSPRGIWRQLGVLPALLGAAAAALVLVIALQFGGLMTPGDPAPTLASRLASEDESLVVAAAFVERTGTLFVNWEEGDRLPDRDVELWLIAGEGAPVSLGVLNKGNPLTEIALPEELHPLLAGATLAVSDEPLGGSPTGAPTGAVLAAGQITAL